ncbi:MAG: serine dehydratase beta chain, partial [Burkholderiaceae bacterium]
MRVADLFKIGIGPSSSHTVGPMLAARRFLLEAGPLDDVRRVQAELYGSLALTGVGHGTGRAVLLGLMGETPQDVDPATVDARLAEVAASGELRLLGTQAVAFDGARDLLWHKRESLPEHPNGMRFTLVRNDGATRSQVFYSTGGGFIRAEGEAPATAAQASVPFPFDTMAELLRRGRDSGLSIAAMLRANEAARSADGRLDDFLDAIWRTMRYCIARGLETGG